MSGAIIWGVALATVLAFAGAAYLAGRKTGRTSTQVRDLQDDAEAYETARQAQRDVDALPDDSVNQRLRERWTR